MTTTKRAFLLLSISFGLALSVCAQTDKPFKKGSVFQVRMVRTNANAQDDYLKQLSTYYVPMMNKAKEEGLIKSFTLLSGDFSNEEDFDIMMLVEYESLAMLDPDAAREAKWQAIRDAMDATVGGKEKAKAIQMSFNDIRTFRGNKLMRKMEAK